MADYEILDLSNIHLQCGLTLPHAQLAYKTYGRINSSRNNVVLIPTFYGGQHTDVESLFGSGRFLDPSRHFIVVPNLFGNGLSSSPSNTRPPFERASFPRVSLYDNVVCQHRLLKHVLKIDRIRLVVGFSMGAQQAFQWGALYPNFVDAIAPICGSARTSPHNGLFLDGVKSALITDTEFTGGWYDKPPVNGLRSFSRVYAGWLFSQDFFRDKEYEKLGLSSVEDTVRFTEAYFRRRDANDLLAMLDTWQNADISANHVYDGNFKAALESISARAIVMPCTTDLYFRVRDNEIEVASMPNAELRPIPSIWGHAAGFGSNPPDAKWIDAALSELLVGL